MHEGGLPYVPSGVCDPLEAWAELMEVVRRVPMLAAATTANEWSLVPAVIAMSRPRDLEDIDKLQRLRDNKQADTNDRKS